MDKSTLPTVPEGYFWRVAPTRDYPDTQAYVELRRKRRWFGSARVASSCSYEIATLTPENVAHIAGTILRHYQGQQTGEGLIGDYPPKEL